MLAAFVAGIVMAMFGMTLLIQKGGRIGSRRIRKAWAFRLGVFLVSFFPVMVVERILLNKYDPDEEVVDRMIVHASLTALWVLLSLVLLFIAIKKPGRARRETTAESPAALDAHALLEVPETFGEPGIAEMGISEPPSKQPGKKKPAQRNPFDFN